VLASKVPLEHVKVSKLNNQLLGSSSWDEIELNNGFSMNLVFTGPLYFADDSS
jgi:hypothetical protein